jgi:mono/diheme cytochrome c family protein
MMSTNRQTGPLPRAGLISLMLLLMALVACSPPEPSMAMDGLPPGDAIRGAALFTESINGSPRCSACHTDTSTSAGPALTNYGDEAGSRTSQSAFEYTLDSVVRPAAHILRGYSNTMYSRYGGRLSAQDIADLIAYMLD